MRTVSRIPVPGQLYYRGIELNEIVEAHRQVGDLWL